MGHRKSSKLTHITLTKLALVSLLVLLAGCGKPASPSGPNPEAVREARAKQAQMHQQRLAELDQKAADQDVLMSDALLTAQTIHRRDFSKSLHFEIKLEDKAVVFRYEVPEGREVEDNRKRVKLRIFGEAIDGCRHLVPVVMARGWQAGLNVFVAGVLVDEGVFSQQRLQENQPDFTLKASEPMPSAVLKGIYQSTGGSWSQIEIRSE